jgi:hypothetical protein
MIVMAKVYFNRPDAEGGIAALRAAGYEVLVHAFDDKWPNFVFLEASRDIEVAHEIQEVTRDAEFDRVDAIIGPLYGEIISIGLLPAGHREGVNSPEAQALNQADTKKVALAAVLEDLVQSGFVADHLIAELRLARVIVDSGQRRDGKIVWVANSALSAEEFWQRLGALLRARFTDPAFQSFVDDPMIVADMAATDAAFQSLIDDGSIVPHPDGLQRPSPKTGKMQPVYVPAEVAAEIIEERGAN